jgi:hypothetical protein
MKPEQLLLFGLGIVIGALPACLLIHPFVSLAFLCVGMAIAVTAAYIDWREGQPPRLETFHSGKLIRYRCKVTISAAQKRTNVGDHLELAGTIVVLILCIVHFSGVPILLQEQLPVAITAAVLAVFGWLLSVIINKRQSSGTQLNSSPMLK